MGFGLRATWTEPHLADREECAGCVNGTSLMVGL